MSKVLEKFVDSEYRSRKVPDFKVGDVVRVHQVVPDIKKGEVKTLSRAAKAIKKKSDEGPAQAFRTQIFEGIVITKKHGKEPGATFTVRKIATGNVGVEKIFPLYSPLVEKIEVVSRPTKRVRRAKLYFLRNRIGKKARKLGVGQTVEQKITSVDPLANQEEEVAEEGNDLESLKEEVKPESQEAEQGEGGNPDSPKEGSEPQPQSAEEEPKEGVAKDGPTENQESKEATEEKQTEKEKDSN